MKPLLLLLALLPLSVAAQNPDLCYSGCPDTNRKGQSTCLTAPPVCPKVAAHKPAPNPKESPTFGCGQPGSECGVAYIWGTAKANGPEVQINMSGELRVFGDDGKLVLDCPAANKKTAKCVIAAGRTLDEAMGALVEVMTAVYGEPAPKPSKEKQP